MMVNYSDLSMTTYYTHIKLAQSLIVTLFTASKCTYDKEICDRLPYMTSAITH